MNKLFFTILLLTCISLSVQAQSSIRIKSKGAQSEQYVTIKGYEIKDTQEYTYIFSQQSAYHISIEDLQDKDVSVNIYDNQRKEVFSNYSATKKKYYKEFIFECPQTGVYYMKVSPKKNNF